MTPDQLLQFELSIVASVEEHLAKGGKVISRFFVDGEHDRCPIACLLGDEMEKRSDKEEWITLHALVSQKMGFEVSSWELWSFIYGFDGNESNSLEPTHELGRALRRRFLP